VNYEGADKLIETYLSDNWVDTPITWQNIEPRDFDSPSLPLMPIGDADYIDIRTEIVGNRSITVDRWCTRGQGQLMIALCAKQGTGDRGNKRRIDTLTELLENQVLNGVDGQVRISNLMGSNKYSVNSWYVLEISLMYYFETYRS